MPDRGTISRVAKILARATSAEPHEAAAALSGAYKRMVRDGVSLSDLLTLPTEELYQDTLVRLVDVILADQENLSPSTRREAYAAYMRLIVEKFSGGAGASHAGDADADDRQRHADDYNRRNGYRTDDASDSSAESGDSDDRAHNKNGKTQKSKNSFELKLLFKGFQFSVTGFLHAIQPLVGRGSILWHTMHDPVRGFRLFAASLLWGCAFAIVLMTIAAIAHVLTNTGPFYDLKFKSVFSFFAAIGTIWKARVFFLGGWFRSSY